MPNVRLRTAAELLEEARVRAGTGAEEGEAGTEMLPQWESVKRGLRQEFERCVMTLPGWW
jgi:hypothetical protein